MFMTSIPFRSPKAARKLQENASMKQTFSRLTDGQVLRSCQKDWFYLFMDVRVLSVCVHGRIYDIYAHVYDILTKMSCMGQNAGSNS